MSYRDYVIAAYVIFAIVMVWDFVSPRWQVIKAKKAALAQARRRAARQQKSVSE